MLSDELSDNQSNLTMKQAKINELEKHLKYVTTKYQEIKCEVS